MEKIDSKAESKTQVTEKPKLEGVELIKQSEITLQDALDDNAKPEAKTEKLKILLEYLQSFDDTFLEKFPGELLESILTTSSDSIYRSFLKHGLRFPQVLDRSNFEIKTVDDWSLYIITRVVEKIPEQVLHTKMSQFSDEKKKMSLESRMIVLEILNYTLSSSKDKVQSMLQVLPLILRNINNSLRKFLKYKEKTSDISAQVSKGITFYLSKYETWVKDILYKTLDQLLEFCNSIKTRSLLSISDLYEVSPLQSGVKTREPSKEKLTTHLTASFCFDILEGLIDVKTNTYFTTKNIEDFISKLMDVINKINPRLEDYIDVKIQQNKFVALYPDQATNHKRDFMTFAEEGYTKYTPYNFVSVAYLALRLTQTPKESALLTNKRKLELLLPTTYELMMQTQEKQELKSALLTTIIGVVKQYEKLGQTYINLGEFGFPLDKFLIAVLDFSGGFVSEKEKNLGIELYMTFKKLFCQSTFSRVLAKLILNSRYHSLINFIVKDFKDSVTNALKNIDDREKLRDSVDPYLNIHTFRLFAEAALNVRSSKYKENPEMNTEALGLAFILMSKYIKLYKDTTDYKSLQFKDQNNLFNPKNKDILIKMFDVTTVLGGKLQKGIELGQEQVNKTKKDPNNEKVLEHMNMKLNEIIMANDWVSRVDDLLKEFKSL